MKFSIVHFEKPSGTSPAENVRHSQNPLNSISNTNNNKNTTTNSYGRKSPPSQKLVMTRRTEILEPLKKLDDLKQIQLSIIQQRLNQSARKSPTNTTLSSESVPSSTCSKSSSSSYSQPIPHPVNKMPIPHHHHHHQHHQTILSNVKLANSPNQSKTIPHQKAISPLPQSHTTLLIQSPSQTVQYLEQSPATLAVPVIYHNVQIPHNHHNMLPNSIIKYHSHHHHHHHHVNTQPKPTHPSTCTVSSEIEERPKIIINRTNSPLLHAPNTLAHHIKSSQPVVHPLQLSPPPQYSKQMISKPSKMSDNAKRQHKQRFSISFNELLNDDHQFIH